MLEVILLSKVIPKRTYRNILNSLGGGTVPREGLGYIAVGREKEIDSLLRDLEIISDGGATCRFIVGDYGSGKTFLIQTIKEYCVKHNFIVAVADLSPDRAFVGTSTKKKGLATYRELMSNVSNKTNQSGHALGKVLDLWINKLFELAANHMMTNPIGNGNIEELTERIMLKETAPLQELSYGYDFVIALRKFWKYSRSFEDPDSVIKKEAVLKWFRDGYSSNQDSKRATGLSMISDDNWFDYIMLWSEFFKIAGYEGFYIMIDELVNIYKMSSSTTRQKNYESMLMMYNSTLQGKARYLGILMGGTPVSIYDKKKGLFSYEAMKSRLSTGLYKDTRIVNMMTPIIKIVPLTKEEMYVLLEKIVEIHADLYGYEKCITEDELIYFTKLAYLKRETAYITPRTMIRDFIQVIDVKRQNPDISIEDILSEYKFALEEEQFFENDYLE